MAEKTHKSLQSTFAAPPQRGAKLQGLLSAGAGRQHRSPGANPDHRMPPPDPASDDPSNPAAPDSPAMQQGSPQSVAVLTAPPEDAGKDAPPTRTPEDTGKDAPLAGTATTSVYLRTKAYRELVDRRQKKFRSYAQTVYDAFADIRDKARDANTDPTEALSKLFNTTEIADPWLMPEPQSARNAAEPTVEAKIAFKRHEREWVEQRMTEAGQTHLSPFLATVLENYLL